MNSVKAAGSSLKGSEITTYSFGALARELANNCVNAYIMIYLSVYVHLNPLWLTAAFVFARMAGAFLDPVVASIINNSKGSVRFGRFKPWIVSGILTNIVCTVLLFLPLNGSEGNKYLYYIGMYLLWSITFSIFDVPYNSMLPTIADSTEERNKLTSWTKLIGGFGAFLITTIGTSLIIPIVAPKSGATASYLIISVTGGILTLCFMSFPVLFNKERYQIPNTRLSIKDILDIYKGNDQLRAASGIFLLFQTSTSVALYQLIFLFEYSYSNGADIFNNAYSYVLFWIISCVLQSVTMVFYNNLTKKVPREKMFSVSFILAIIGYLLMFFIFFLLKPANGDEYVYLMNTVIVGVSAIFLMIGNGVYIIGATVMTADIIDYGEWKTGKRGDSIVFSIQTLIGKFSIALAILILGIGISIAKLPTVREIFDEAGQVFIKQFVDSQGNVAALNSNPGSLIILRSFMFLIPIPLTVIAYIILKRKYWLFGKKYDEIKNELNSKR